MTDVWTPYSGQDSPRSPGRMLLSEFLEVFYEVHWNAGADEIRPAFGGADAEAARTLRSTIDFLGSLVADGTIAAAARPIGGGTPIPMRQNLWEVDDYDGRFRSSALSLEDWSDLTAPSTHWIFVSEADVGSFLDHWKDNTFNEPVLFEEPTVVPEPGSQAETSAVNQPAVAAGMLRLPAVMNRTGLSRSTIYAHIAAGVFPRQVALGARAAGWYEHGIDAWVQSRRAAPILGR